MASNKLERRRPSRGILCGVHGSISREGTTWSLTEVTLAKTGFRHVKLFETGESVTHCITLQVGGSLFFTSSPKTHTRSSQSPQSTNFSTLVSRCIGPVTVMVVCKVYLGMECVWLVQQLHAKDVHYVLHCVLVQLCVWAFVWCCSIVSITAVTVSMTRFSNITSLLLKALFFSF